MEGRCAHLSTVYHVGVSQQGEDVRVAARQEGPARPGGLRRKRCPQPVRVSRHSTSDDARLTNLFIANQLSSAILSTINEITSITLSKIHLKFLHYELLLYSHYSS